MMYAELYQYLILHKKLPVPGIGTFLLERKPAQGDFLNKQILAPEYSVTMQQNTISPSMVFFGWLGDALGITDRDAVIRFNDFAFDMKRQITSSNTIQWNCVGILSRGLAGEIKFTETEAAYPENPVAAKKIIREKAEHMVRVGEDEKSSTEMTAALTKTISKKSYWWVPALIISVLAIGFIAWYFYTNGMDVSSAGNTVKLTPGESGAPYNIIQ
ncbi:MAG TPA: hypothetical protein VN451_03635 [Chitinophagaceae bacterium]|nr:hypothetical protein [Chitinophagaceae bacterium]